MDPGQCHTLPLSVRVEERRSDSELSRKIRSTSEALSWPLPQLSCLLTPDLLTHTFRRPPLTPSL